MMKCFFTIFLWLELVFCNQAQASVILFKNWDEVDWALVDRPKKLAEKVKTALAGIDVEQQTESWAMHFYMYSRIPDGGPEESTIRAAIERALAAADRQGLVEVRIRMLLVLQAYLFDQPDTSIKVEDQYRAFEAMLRLCEQHQLQRLKAQVLIQYALMMWDVSFNTRVFKMLDEAHDLLRSDPATTELQMIRHDEAMAWVYEVTKQYEESLARFGKILQWAERSGLAYKTMETIYNMTLVVIMNNDYPQFRATLDKLNQGLTLTHQASEQQLHGSMLISKGRILLHFGEHAAAIAALKEAFDDFAEITNVTWQAIALRYLAQAQNKAGLHREALAALDRSGKFYPADYLSDWTKIEEERYIAYKALGLKREAAIALKKHIEADREINEQVAPKEFAAAAISLRVLLENEQQKALEYDNEIQANALAIQTSALASQRLRQNLVLALLSLLFLAGLAALLGFVWLRRQGHRIHDLHRFMVEGVLRRFLPPEIVDEVASGKWSIPDAPQVAVVTVMFAELQGLTANLDQVDPIHMAQFLNRYFQSMTDIIFDEGGTIDKFIGGTIMILFGAPSPMDPSEQIERACRCARKMHAGIVSLGDATLGIRISIHQGPAIAGSFGSAKRSDYTVVGNTVNIAARMLPLALSDQILISDTVKSLVPPHMSVPFKSVQLKGIQATVNLHLLTAEMWPEVAV